MRLFGVDRFRGHGIAFLAVAVLFVLILVQSLESGHSELLTQYLGAMAERRNHREEEMELRMLRDSIPTSSAM
jgi:hypothetical protein